MVTAVTRGMSRVIDRRRFEDYKSMKQHFQHRNITELIFDGYQTFTNAAANLEPGDLTIVLPGAEGTVYLSTLVNDANQDAKKVWIVYQDDTGEIHSILTYLDNDNDTSDEVPLGCEAVVTTVQNVAGDTLELVGVNSTVVNDLAGMFIVGCGDATHQPGAVLEILSNTIATPSVITCTSTPNANWDLDNVSLQSYEASDFFRLREMYCEVEVLTDKTIRLGTFDSGAYYGLISQGGRYSSSARYFTRPAANARCFLGVIHTHCSNETTVSKKQGNEFQVTLTPKARNSDGESADIVINIVFQDHIHWEPCIELEPGTDVNIQVLTLDDTNVDDGYFEVRYFEVIE